MVKIQINLMACYYILQMTQSINLDPEYIVKRFLKHEKAIYNSNKQFYVNNNKFKILLVKIENNNSNINNKIESFFSFLNGLKGKKFYLYACNFFQGLKNMYDFYCFLKNTHRAQDHLKKNKTFKYGITKNIVKFQMLAVNTDDVKREIILQIKKNFKIFLISNLFIKKNHYEIIFNKIKIYLNFIDNKKIIYLIFLLKNDLFNEKFKDTNLKINSNKRYFLNISIIYKIFPFDEAYNNKKIEEILNKPLLKILDREKNSLKNFDFDSNNFKPIFLLEFLYFDHEFHF